MNKLVIEREYRMKNASVKIIREELLNGKTTCEQLVKEIFAKIEKDKTKPKPLNALTNVFKEKAILESKAKDKMLQNKAKEALENELFGIPIIIKDNINIEGENTSCGSKILETYKATFDATVIKKLKEAGVLMVGKSNMDEFAMGSSSERSIYGAVRNPKDLDRTAGGSSGGSAALVSAGFVPIGLGSDTGGSIRQPAAFCGVVGLKPTYGRVSRYGLVAYASSFDQIGPITNTVYDCALILSVISGKDNNDTTTKEKRVLNYTKNLDKDIKGKRIGIPKEYIKDLPKAIQKSLNRAKEKLSDLGCTLKEISLPHTEYSIPTYYIISTAEASSNLSRFDGIRYGYRSKEDNLLDTYLKSRSKGFGEEVKRRIMLGTYVLSSGYYDAYYLKAQKVRRLMRDDYNKAFNAVDAILTPTTPTTAFKLGEKMSNPISMYLSDIFTASANVVGLPAISIPYDKDENNLPIGIQLMGNYFKEQMILNIANQLEKS